MKLSCQKDQLQHAVQTVQKAIATKTPLPILTGIYFEARENELQLQATDYEIGISCTISAAVEEPGAVVLSGKYFQEMVRRLPGETVNISSSQEDRTIKITSNNAQFNLLSLPPEEFPVLKPVSSENILLVKDTVLRELIKKTVFACASDEARPIFTGGLLEVEDAEIRMVATNTHRLALKREKLDESKNNVKMIIPSKILNELARLLGNEDPQDVTLSWQKNQVGIAYDNVFINSRLIEGQFPDYKKVIPPTYSTTIKINTDQFLDAVERVSLLAREGEYNVVKFSFQKDSVIITSNNPDVGKAYETVPAEKNGNDVEIAFNAKYVSDILKNIDSQELLFSLNTSLSPAHLKPWDDDNYTYIITPVRTN
ncbi:MAG: DNA polymerase III subunit beta [Negativicutes bacterium]|nr:DNA polymerase III subunit beta [Negativicutes bacterium]